MRVRPCWRFWLVAFALIALGGCEVGEYFSSQRQLAATWNQPWPGRNFEALYPPVLSDSEAVHALNSLAVQAGIQVAPEEEPGQPQPTADSATRLEALETALRQQRDPGEALWVAPPTPLPSAARAILDELRPTLERVSQLLASRPALLWRNDLDPASTLRRSSRLPYLKLGRLLASDALLAQENGDDATVEARLEALWLLSEAVLQRPETLDHFIGLALVQLQLTVLGTRPQLSEKWVQRLQELDLCRRVLLGLELEAWRGYRLSELPSPPPYWGLHQEWETERRLLRFGALRNFTQFTTLTRFPPHQFDPGRFYAEQPELTGLLAAADAQIPNLLDIWSRAGHAELAAELLVLAAAERRRLAESPGKPPPLRVPSRQPGLTWLQEPDADGTHIHLDTEFLWHSRRARPLSVHIPR
jgi:hypothetical protein